MTDYYSSEKEPENRVFIRLRTASWYDGKSLHVKRSLTFLKRQCSGYNFLDDDLRSGGAEDVALTFTNLYECEDGIYEVVHCNVSRDWESGIVDDWDYKLVPFVEGASK